jgi:hypothetical protein
MCYDCNQKKGNGDPRTPKVYNPQVIPERFNYTREGISIGDIIYRKVKKNKFSELGILEKIVWNEIANREAITIVGREKSMYNINAVYKKYKLC